MNKILTLYNIEFKRIYKLYLVLAGLLFTGNIGIVLLNLYNTMYEVAGKTNAKATIGLLKSPLAKSTFYNSSIANIYNTTNLMLGLAVILCLIYAICIWYRDFVGKSKTAYTLFMLPNKKFSIYISKAITVVVMIYGLMIAQLLAWFIDLSIIKELSGINLNELIEACTYSGRGIHLIQPYIIDFLLIDVFGVILAVVVIFTGVMIQRSFKKIGIVLGPLYIAGSILIYVFLSGHFIYTDERLIAHCIYLAVLFISSIGISYTAINKKIYM